MSRGWIGRHAAWIWLIGALLCIAVIGIVTAGTSRPVTELSPRSADGPGGLALSLWLARLGYTVEDHTSAFPSPPLLSLRDTTLVLLPDSDLSVTDARDYLGWVMRGGRLVIVTSGTGGAHMLAALRLRVTSAPSAAIDVWQPLMLSPQVRRVSGSADAIVDGLPSGAEEGGTDFGPVLVTIQRGRGEILVLSAPVLLENSALRDADNRALALNIAGTPHSTVIFDEYSAPVSPAASDWLSHTVWGVLVLFLLAVGVLYRWLSGRRLGKPVVPLAEGHRAATEYVLSIALLLQAGHKRVETLERYQQGLRRVLRERYGAAEVAGLPSEMRVRVERLLSTPPGLGERTLIRRAAEIIQCEDDVRSHRV